MRHKYHVPLVSHDLTPSETVLQIADALDALDPDDGMALLLGEPQQVAGFPAERNENSSREEM